MARDLPTGFAAKAESAEFLPVFLVQLDWSGGTVYFWNGYGEISWDGHTWTGTGDLGGISEIRESANGRANGVTLTLSGIPAANILEALANDSQGQPGYIWLTSMNRQGAFEFDPYQIFDGVIDLCPFTEQNGSATISVQLEKELIDRRVHSRRRTNEDQLIDYSGDAYFEFVAGLALKVVNWGGPAQMVNGALPIYSQPVNHNGYVLH